MAEEADPNTEQTQGSDATDPQEVVEAALADAQASVDQLKEETDLAEGSADTPAEANVADAGPGIDLPDLAAGASAADADGIDMLRDVDLHVTIELGRTQMLVEDVLKLNDGAVVELDKLAGDPVDVYVNDCLIARGEVLVLNDDFCIRISEIVENLEEQAEEAAREQMGAV